jgi:hypothetical protein
LAQALLSCDSNLSGRRFHALGYFLLQYLAPLYDLLTDFRMAGIFLTRQVIAKADQLLTMVTQPDLLMRRIGSSSIALHFDKPVLTAALCLGNVECSLAIALSRIELRS